MRIDRFLGLRFSNSPPRHDSLDTNELLVDSTELIAFPRPANILTDGRSSFGNAMAALIQSYPSQSSTVIMLQARPSSASAINHQPGNHYSPSASQMHRNSYHGMNGAPGPSTYRGHTSVAPVAPYAFSSTPSLNPSPGRPQPGPFQGKDQRTISAPVTATMHHLERSRYPAPASISTTSSSSSSSDIPAAIRSAGTRDDSAIASTPASGWGGGMPARPKSTVITSLPPMLPPLEPIMAKASPDRYRRAGNRRVDSSGSGNGRSPTSSNPASPSGNNIAAGSFPFTPAGATTQSPTASFYSQGVAVRASADDMRLKTQQPPVREEASRYRRRSVHGVEVPSPTEPSRITSQTDFAASGAAHRLEHQHPLRSFPVDHIRPTSSPVRNTFTENVRGHRSHASQPSVPLSNTMNPAQSKSTPVEQSTLKHDQSQTQPQPRIIDISGRPSPSSDATKRVANPSPLSKPVTMGDMTATKNSFASAVTAAMQTPASQQLTAQTSATSVRPDSPAARQLAALGGSDKKSKTSRLRRAFSFGSAAELRKVSIEPPAQASNDNNAGMTATDRARLRKERYQDEREAEQAKIAERQEAGGIGAGIYSGQGNFFSGSTDNLSISSTASSASVMLRKMGKGMKKSTRSLVGLFRPKSVIGVPAADAPLPDFSQAQVSMVTVEAERERVNVNANPHDQVGGGTGFPKLERNSIDAANSALLGTPPTSATEAPRRANVNGDGDRAEVLAAVKKGILKRAATDGPKGSMVKAVDSRPNFNLPNIPVTSDSPNSSAPSTPNDDSQGHKRTGSVVLNGEDYFMSALRFRGDSVSKSSPATPRGTMKRNATFSPRIQFHDTWTSGEYDRRGEIAACNRLTPMLAQQIKEELNSFKMEMEVHEGSKVYTHFF